MTRTQPRGTLTSAQVILLAGGTYRQLDHWIRTGVIPPDVIVGDPNPGSGSYRFIFRTAVEPIAVCVRVSAALSGLADSDLLARVYRAVEAGDREVNLRDGINLTWSPG